MVSGKTGELEGATSYLANMRWGWMVMALFSEAVAYLAYAALQRRLLLSGHVKARMTPMVGLGLAATAIQNSLPGGLAFYAVYAFRQYRRFGADEVLAGWTLVALNAISFVTLSFLSAAGLAMALGAGSTLDLVEVIVGIAIVALLVVLAWSERRLLLYHSVRLVRLSQRVLHRPDPSVPARELVDHLVARIAGITPSRADWARATTMGMCNWLADCGCLVFSFIAVGSGVPWRGMLLAYGAAQLASILPITPGGLGVVEGSLTVALVTFGGAEASTVAAVLLYRLISFWLLMPVGWGSWGALALAGRDTRSAPRTPLETAA